jgi:hypothetical protein
MRLLAAAVVIGLLGFVALPGAVFAADGPVPVLPVWICNGEVDQHPCNCPLPDEVSNLCDDLPGGG